MYPGGYIGAVQICTIFTSGTGALLDFGIHGGGAGKETGIQSSMNTKGSLYG
jgi:hypothetical protein